MPLDELAVIARLRRLAGEGAFDFRDDAARLTPPPGCDLVVTADMLASGVHFLPDDPPDSVARKALRVNLSDLAAKGARPLGYMLSLGLAAWTDEAWLDGFVAGLEADQMEFAIALLGGDTIAVAAGPVISVTAFGTVPEGRMVHRFGGSPGDLLYVSGTIGASTVGLALLQGRSGPWDTLPASVREALIGRYRIPEPRLALAEAVADLASAAMDVSDGLVGDCDKIAAASGCTARIEADSVPLPAGLAEGADASLVARLITGGDDYEILAAVPPAAEAAFAAAADAAGVLVTRIGALRAGAGASEVVLGGRALDLGRRSYAHGDGAGA
jgi:thiamine-monophosphate kinase